MNYSQWFIDEILEELAATNNDFILVSRRLLISMQDLMTIFAQNNA